MSRPQSEAEYLARMVPSSVAATRGVSRRSFLRGASVVGAGLAAPAVLAACGGGDDPGTTTSPAAGGGTASGEVTFGLNEAEGTGLQYDRRVASIDAFQAANSDLTIALNAVDHNTFQEQINNYLQGNPDDVFTWFAGFRMRFFAEKGLIGDISDIYPIDGISDAFLQASTGNDGKQYFVPEQNYPWAVFYRKSLWEENGWTPPTTLEEFTTLATDIQGAGITPVAFADKDGWPAMGTFDVLNMRINGYDFHISLMAGEESWDSEEVKEVFRVWAELLPFHQEDSLGRTWQEAAQSLQKNESAMYLLGLFVTDQFPDEQDDFDFFTFPEIDSAIGAKAIDAPIDGYCMSAAPANEAGAKAFLQWLGSAENADAQSAAGYTQIWVNSGADQAPLTDLQKRAAAFIGEQENIAQFLDRDTRPDFASTVMIPALQQFIGDPSDIDGLTASIEEQKQAIFATEAS
jgi:multiple sugar transport system substrate-binding protein